MVWLVAVDVAEKVDLAFMCKIRRWITSDINHACSLASFACKPIIQRNETLPRNGHTKQLLRKFQLKVNMWQIAGYKGNRKSIEMRSTHGTYRLRLPYVRAHPCGRSNWKLETRDPLINSTRLLPALTSIHTPSRCSVLSRWSLCIFLLHNFCSRYFFISII